MNNKITKINLEIKIIKKDKILVINLINLLIGFLLILCSIYRDLINSKKLQKL